MLFPARSTFSYSTMSSSPPPAPLDSQATKDVGGLTSAHATHDPGAGERRKCVDILMRVINVIKHGPAPFVDITKNLSESKLQHDMVAHFHHHDTFVLMRRDFYKLAEWMADAVKTGIMFHAVADPPRLHQRSEWSCRCSLSEGP
jgi:hypothetical protein